MHWSFLQGFVQSIWGFAGLTWETQREPFSCFRIQSCRATKYRLWKQKQMLWFLQQLRKGLLMTHESMWASQNDLQSHKSLSSASFSESNWTFFFLSPSSMLLHLPPTLHFHHQTAQTQLHSCLLIDAHLFLIKTWRIAYGAPCDDWLLVFKHPEICCGLPYCHQVYSKNCQERNHFKGCQSLWSHLWWERREVLSGWRNCSKNYINNELLPITLTSYEGESTCCFDLQTLCYFFLQIHSIPMHTYFPFGHRRSIPSSAVNERKRSSAFEMEFSPHINCV